MVTLDYCKRIRLVTEQLLPDVMADARSKTNLKEIKYILESVLPDLEEKTYDLIEKCELSENYQNISLKEKELIDKNNIKEKFARVRKTIEEFQKQISK